MGPADNGLAGRTKFGGSYFSFNRIVPEDDKSEKYSTFMEKMRKARAVLITALGNKPLRVVQTASDPLEMWRKLHDRYAGSSSASKIGVLTSLMNKKYSPGKDMGEYLTELESMFNRLCSMGMPIAEPMQVAILLVSLGCEEEMAGTVAAIKTMDEDRATWDYVSSRLLEEQRSRRLVDQAGRHAAEVKAAAARKPLDTRKFVALNVRSKDTLPSTAERRAEVRNPRGGRLMIATIMRFVRQW